MKENTKLLIGDGGMGSELRFRGVEVPSHIESIWSALALTTNPDVIKAIHLDYIKAGADYITANNYAVTQPILERADMSDRLEELTLLSISIAHEAIKESGKDVLLAASLPPLETSYRADLILDFDQMKEQYSELAAILEGKVDIIICETMAHSLEARAALESIQISRSQKWLAWTLHGNRSETLPSGENIVDAFDATSDLECDAYFINCCGANMVTEAIGKLRKLTKKPIGAYANSEFINTTAKNSAINAEEDHWSSATTIDDQEYFNEVEKWISKGANIIGGCCRTRPSHIQTIVDKLS